MKVECSWMLSEATDRAATTGLVHQHALHLSPTRRNRTGIAFRTPVATLRSSVESRPPMLRAAEIRLMKAGLARAISFPLANAPGRFQSQAVQPIAHGRVADTELRGYCSYGGAFLDQLSNTRLVYRPVGRVPLRPNRPQAVLLQPIADRGGMPACLFANRVQRHTPCQAILEEVLSHDESLSVVSDRKIHHGSDQPPTRSVRAMRSTRAARSRLRAARRS